MSVSVPAACAPVVDADAVTFSLSDEDLALSEVSLIQELQRPRLGPGFRLDETKLTWQLRFPRPEADRMEYLFHLRHDDGREETINDPANPAVAPGPFGSKSVIEFPGYEAPSWITEDKVPEDEVVETAIRSRVLRADLRVLVWSPAGTERDEPLPLLVAHDGPEYDEIADLLKLLRCKVTAGDLPRLRAALLAPVERDQTYSASAAYARSLSYEIIPRLGEIAPTPHGRGMRAAMGASLGALAMLHAHRVNPAIFGSLFLQSGSYFRQRFDKQESGFSRFGRISRFMGRVLTAEDWPHPIPVTLTCGTVEENLANNRATAAALRRQGYDSYLHENRDAHNWVAWRDTFDPHLVDLLRRSWD